MDSLLATLQQWHVHPVADHFTIAFIMVGVLADLIGSLAPSYRWIRYMALTLIILGAISAVASWQTGGWEAHKVHNLVTGEAKALFHRHAELGEWLAGTFAALALWRLGIEAFGFAAGSRPLYLITAVVAVFALGYQGYLGGEIVYDYGVGTVLLTPTPAVSPTPKGSPSPEAAQTPHAAATPLPTVYVPPPSTPTATASVEPASPAVSPSASTAPASPAPTSSP